MDGVPAPHHTREDSAMTEFIIKDFDKWFHQNRAEYTGAFFEGVLLDNFVLDCKRGYAFVYEHALTEWTSAYRVKFAPYKDWDTCMKLFDEFYELEDEVNAYIEGSIA